MPATPASSAHRENVERLGRWLDIELAGRGLPPLLVLVGLGDGAVLDAIGQRAPDTRVLALEPDPRRARAFLDDTEWQDWRTSGRLVYLADPDYAGADQAWRIFPPGMTVPVVLLHPDATPTEGLARAAQRLKQIVFGVTANADARRRFAPRYLVNAIRNLPAIVAGSDVRHLTDAYRGMPAIVAGAGPSLDAAIRTLRTMPNRGVLIASDTALRPLLAAGIAPTLAVALDPSTENARHLLTLPECRDTWLVSEAALDRDATSVFDGRTFWFRASNHHPGPWLRELGVDMEQLEVWGSVLTGAFQVACLAGCDPIVFVGADLSFTDDRPYARGTTHELAWAEATAAGIPLRNAWRTIVEAGQLTPDLRGDMTRATPALLSFRDWMVAHAARSGRRIVNASGAGIFFGDGIEQAPLGDVLSDVVSVPPGSAVARRWSGVRPTAIAAQVRKVRATLTAGTPAPLLAAWREFSGDGFDATTVGVALDDAAQGLERRRHAPVRSVLDPWARQDMAATLLALVQRLPEAIGSKPAGLLGPLAVAQPGEVTTRLTDEERADVLLRAWDLLARICDVTLHEADDLALRDVNAIGLVGVGASYDWPSDVRWNVAVFEGLLGDVWSSVSRQATPAPSIRLLPGLDAADRSPRPNAACACALLTLEWLRCSGVAPETCAMIAESLRADAASIASDGPASVRHGAALAVETIRHHVTGAPDLRLSFGGPVASLLHAGTLSADVPTDMPARFTCDASGALRLAGPDLSAMARTARPGGAGPHLECGDGRVVRPRLVTRDGRTDAWFVGYGVADGVVCVSQHQRESVLVDADGHVRPHRAWPRPINQECRFGEDGVLAWGSGFALPTALTPPYVMYRRHAADQVTIEELPFRPAFGTWWRGRMYWSVFSRRDPWRGLVSWAPDEGMRVEQPDLVAWAILPRDEVLEIQPCDFSPRLGWRRRLQTTGWRLRQDRTLEPLALGPYGSAASIATAGLWTAIAHPDIDTIRLESTDGRSRALTCPSPLGIAWADSSLLVSTLSCDLLLFDGLLDSLV
ncbi:MAG: DUF115 domain-containing protein [Acidobacteria bacterium]|nr:DUF115 domain-containing protein [Acidobacteriota bacterium]